MGKKIIPGAIDSFRFTLFAAIRHGLSEGLPFPTASINEKGAIVIMFEQGKEGDFGALPSLFNQVCAEQEVSPLDASQPFLYRAKIGHHVRYVFNVSAKNLDALWMQGSNYLHSIAVPMSRYLEEIIKYLHEAIKENEARHHAEQAIAHCKTANETSRQSALQKTHTLLPTDNDSLTMLKARCVAKAENLELQKSLPLLEAQLKALSADLNNRENLEQTKLGLIADIETKIQDFIDIQVSYEMLCRHGTMADDELQAMLSRINIIQATIKINSEDISTEKDKLKSIQAEIALMRETAASLQQKIDNAATVIAPSLQDLEAEYTKAISPYIAALEAEKQAYCAQLETETAKAPSPAMKVNIPFLASEVARLDKTAAVLQEKGPAACITMVEAEMSARPPTFTVDVEERHQALIESLEANIRALETLKESILQEEKSSMQDKLNVMKKALHNIRPDDDITPQKTP